MKMKKIIVISLLITILLSLILNILPATSIKSYAADMDKGTLSRDIDGLDENIYPGYKQLIKDLQAKYSNYVFLLYYTGLDWNEVLTAEYQGHGRSPKNLFQIGSNYNGMWVCPICGTAKYDNGTWCCSSLESLAYMMDPRNSINESDIFQFKDLEGSDVSYEDIQRVVSGYGSYLNNPEAIQAIVDASREYNINGYFLVAKIINEHGKNGSTLSNGQGYNGQYFGVYNYFNINSTGSGSDAIIKSGLAYAQSQGWTSIAASIKGGTAVVRNSYMDTYSQNTFYYQKFNVSGRSTLASHQYQQNIMAAQSQGASLKSYYGSSNTAGQYTFIIPLYKNMPRTASVRPDVTKANSITYEDGVIKNISTSLTVRAAGRTSGIAIGKLVNNQSIKIIKRASSPVDGYFWDTILTTDGTYGYAARNPNSGMPDAIVSTGVAGSSSGTVGEQNPPASEPSTGDTSSNGKPAGALEGNAKIDGTNFEMLPNVTCESIKNNYPNATIKDKNGNAVNSGKIGTGYKVTINDSTYTVVKSGDVNGDTDVDIADVVAMINSIKNVNILKDEYKKAAMVKNNTDFDIADVVLLINYIKGTAKISL